MPERAEIEAVDDLWEWTRGDLIAEIRRLRADRVRDARGDDEAAKVTVEPGRRPFDPSKAARSPQDEDHEDVVQGALRELRTGPLSRDATIAEAVRYALSRVSPSRDGSVAVEDVAAWLETRAQTVHGPGAEKVGDTYRAFLAAFGPARAGESDEGGNQ